MIATVIIQIIALVLALICAILSLIHGNIGLGILLIVMVIGTSELCWSAFKIEKGQL